MVSSFRIFNCGLRNISRARKIVAAQGRVALFCSQQGDMGRVFGQRVQEVRFYLKRYTFTQIRQCIHRALLAVANQVVTSAAVVAFTRKSRSVVEVQRPLALARQPQALQAHTLGLAVVYTNQQKMQPQS